MVSEPDLLEPLSPAIQSVCKPVESKRQHVLFIFFSRPWKEAAHKRHSVFVEKILNY